MIRFLIHRPIAVLMSFITISCGSVLAYLQLPVSLLPDIDVPTMVINVRYAEASAPEIENNVLKLIRDKMSTLNYLQDIRSVANTGNGQIKLQFEFGSPMDLLYVEVNEKLDQLTDNLPRDLERPQVLRIRTSDIPVARIQVIPIKSEDYLVVSKLTEKVLQKRLERLEGISLVDISGQQQEIISINLDVEKILSLGLLEEDIFRVIENSNQELGSLSIKDGQYRYYLRIANYANNLDSLQKLPVPIDSGHFIYLNEIADIQQTLASTQGYHILNGQKGLVITMHKQAQANMQSIVQAIIENVDKLQQEYPQIMFSITQDQSHLLIAGIDNLTTSLLFGGVFAFAILFFFMGNYQTPIIIGISLPITVLISFLFFYIFGLTINIISLSGLGLGIGMLIDNSIIVLDNIQRHEQGNISLTESCVRGVAEVMPSLISAMLTTLSVFVPLVFLSGIGGALFYDQAFSIGIILFISLLVAFILIPLLYRLFMRQRSRQLHQNNQLYQCLLRWYEYGIIFCFTHKRISIGTFFLLVPILLLTSITLEIEGLPSIKNKELILRVDWNEPLTIEENYRRVIDLGQQVSYQIAEAEIGLTQFMLDQQNRELDQAEIFFEFDNYDQKHATTSQLRQLISTSFPKASFQLTDASNAFNQLFSDQQPYLEVRLKGTNHNQQIALTKVQSYIDTLRNNTLYDFVLGAGFDRETVLSFTILYEKLALYGVSPIILKEKLKQLFSEYQVGKITSFGEITPIVIKQRNSVTLFQKIRHNYVRSSNNEYYPLSEFLSYDLDTDYKTLTSDKTGIYQSLIWKEAVADTDRLIEKITNIFSNSGISITLTGNYISDRNKIFQLGSVLFVAILLLYFILAAQFESFVQPFIVIFSLPLGIGGSFFLLFLTDTSINIMSTIGIIIVLGIIVNDAIIKIDTINRLYQNEKNSNNKLLLSVIHKAGLMRLKPIIMTSVTTILAVLPILFLPGIGSDLQSPLVISVVGGLTIGTFTSLFFVPLAYWLIYGEHKKSLENPITPINSPS